MNRAANGKGLWLGAALLTFLPPLPMIGLILTMMYFFAPSTGEMSFPVLAIIIAITQFVFAALATLLCFGPIWFILHKVGKRERWHAFVSATICYGVALSVLMLPQLAAMPDNNPGETAFGQAMSVGLPLVTMSLIYGAVAAFLSWRLAYRTEEAAKA